MSVGRYAPATDMYRCTHALFCMNMHTDTHRHPRCRILNITWLRIACGVCVSVCACVRHTDRQQTERQTDRPARVPVSVAAGGKGDSLGTKGDSPCRILRPNPCMYVCTINTYIVVYEAWRACVARTHNRHTHLSHMMHSHVRPSNARTITRTYRRL